MGGVAEQLEGIGSLLLNNEKVGEAFYSITVRRAGQKEWDYPFARFRPRGYTQFYDLLNKTLTLVLEDGRRWDCCITGLDGTVAAKGAWPRRPAE